MHDIRRWMTVAEGHAARLMEIEIGGDVDDGFINDVQDRGDFANPQHDLFPEIPTLDPHLPHDSRMQIVGAIGSLRVVKVDPKISAAQHAENAKYNQDYGKEVDYVLFDRNVVVGWVGVFVPPKQGFDIDVEQGIAGQIGSVYLKPAYRGRGLGLALYSWILTHVCDYLVADELQTGGGVKLWRKALNSRRFDVLVYDRRTGLSRRRWAGKDFNQVYNTYDLVPWMTLKGKADRLLSDDVGDEDIVGDEEIDYA